ncbi:RNA polymerase sigma factor [Capnocytophaga felis]|uniref:DNA-directed RNA polymerase sigma-70 factor n=1 Tax=Capnocytophaga felis TaxID=2267611 RepID=A0A5M4B973_9FLAO|nr:RNA polymerase sigma factor [Capnocytophaga felis]GET46161.1 DNA-directed RNA polymerase sigma-70 factor [Capnocytophaga felis]GET48952.1 DNA-directed RNA polymerase sigma-70 factor [Capnocytophaga felis]
MTSNDNDNEQMLLLEIQKGSEQAMREIYCKYVRYLTAVCSRYLQDEEDVKDVLQEGFLKIFSSVSSFEYRGVGSLKGWMTKIIVNETLKFMKRNSQAMFVELKQEKMDTIDDEPDTSGIPSDVIHQMIRELPEGYRTIFNLYVIEEKSHKEIAALLNIKENSSASQFHRAKLLLADKIKQYRTLNSVSL